jgi:hypothetical protein
MPIPKEKTMIIEAKKTTPWIPVGHPDFKWTSGADVQALWRKYGWTPPSEKMAPPPPEKPVPAVADTTAPWVAAPRIHRFK